MMVEINDSHFQRWIHRLLRLQRRGLVKFRDIERDVDWHLLGSKRFYTRYYMELRRSHKWCFIVGCNNSGTSLLQRILEESGQISTLPSEGLIYTNVLRRTGRRGYERVWTEYLSELRKLPDDSTAQGPRLLHDWMRDLPLPLNEVIVEKSPVNTARMRWLQEIFPYSYFIGLVRNGFAVTEGIHRKGRKSYERGARHWNAVNKLMLDEAKGVRNFELIKYEDLVDDPVGTAGRLAEFLELDRESIRSAMDNEFTFRTIKGDGALALANMNEESISRLSASDKENIRTIAAEMLSFFGYAHTR